MQNYYIDDQRLQLLKHFTDTYRVGDREVFLKYAISGEFEGNDLSLLDIFIETLEKINLSFDVIYLGLNKRYIRLIKGLSVDGSNKVDVLRLWEILRPVIDSNEIRNFVIDSEEYNKISKKISVFIDEYLDMNFNNLLSVKKYNYYNFNQSKDVFIRSIKNKDLLNKTNRTFILEKEIYVKSRFGDFEPSKYLFMHTIFALAKYKYIDINGYEISIRGIDELKSVGKVNITIKDKFIRKYGDFLNLEKKLVKEKINIKNITIKVIDGEVCHMYVNGSKYKEMTREKIQASKKAWTLLNLLSIGNIQGSEVNISVDALIGNFDLNNENREKNKNTIHKHKSELEKRLKSFLNKFFILEGFDKFIIEYKTETQSYKTLFAIEPEKELRQKHMRIESRGNFDENIN